MNGIKTMTVTALLSLALGSAVLAQGNGNGNGHGASSMAPGHMKGDGSSARELAPGRQMNAMRSADGATSSVRRSDNYGTLISLLRSGRSDLSRISPDVSVTVVDVDTVIPNGNRQALDNALTAREAEIDALRDMLDGLGAAALRDVNLEDVVAVETAADGSLVVYIDD